VNHLVHAVQLPVVDHEGADADLGGGDHHGQLSKSAEKDREI
jgi:hypothetical protein